MNVKFHQITSYTWIFRILPFFSQFLWNVTFLFSGSHEVQSLMLLQMTKYLFRYPASRGYIFAVWVGVRKVASADNRSIFYCACMKLSGHLQAKLIVRSVVKWCEFCRNKILWQLWSATQDSSNTLIPLLDGFKRLPAVATFRTTAHTAKM